jgi:hypothetical protein
MKKKYLLAVRICIACSAFVLGNAHAQAESDEWQYSVTPYLWLPTIDGTLNYGPPPAGGGGPDVEMGPTDWLDLLNFGALVSGSARKGRFTIFSDFVYLSLQSKDGGVRSVDDTISVPGVPVPIPISATLNTSIKTDFDGLAWSIAAGYAVKETETSSMDVFAGVRYFGTDAKTSWNLSADITTPGGSVVLPAQGSVGKDTDLWDGIVGIRGDFELYANKWSVPYYLDIGTGSSELTWQAAGGLAYTFDWGDLMMMYRHLEYDQDSSSLMQNFSFSGPLIGGRFHF